MTLYALAADMGGTRTRIALVDRDGNIESRHAADTLADRGRDDVMNRFVEALEMVASSVDKDSLIGVGISMASPTDPATGEMYNPPNLPGDEWHRYSPISLLEERLGLPAFINNDATLISESLSTDAADTLAERGRDDVMNRFVEALEMVASSVDKESLIGVGTAHESDDSL